MTFSVAKPFAALAFLDAVAEGHLGSRPAGHLGLARVRAGRQGAARRCATCSPTRPGSPPFPRRRPRVEYDDREALVDLLAAAAPVHPPGAGVAEHALTYGHLLDEVLRRATGEPLVERFARIAAAAGWDLHLRVEPADLARVATLVEPTGRWRSGYLADPRWGPALGRPAGLLDAGGAELRPVPGHPVPGGGPARHRRCPWRSSTTT